MTDLALSTDAVKMPGYCERMIHSKDREAWLEKRELGIGASESAVIMGLSPYKSLYTLYHQKMGHTPRNAVDNRYVTWGNRLEPVVAQAFADETGREIEFDGWLYASTLHPWLVATPDYRQGPGQDALLECKTADARQKGYWENGCPPHYQCQVQHQMIVTGLSFASIAVLIGGNDFRWLDVEPHLRFQGALIAKTERYIKMLLGKLPPPEPDASRSSSETLVQLVEDGRAVRLPDVALDWHHERLKAVEDEKAARERKKEYEALLQAAVGTATYAILPGENGMYQFKTEWQPQKIIPPWEKRRLRHKKKVELPEGK